MKRKLPVLIAIALVLIISLAACKNTEQPVNTTTSPTFTPKVDPTLFTTPATTEPTVAPASEPQLIAMDEAIAIALQDAGFDQAQVAGLHAELERDDGITIYDVDFYKDGKEYDYEIHAETGEILKPVKKTSAGASSDKTTPGTSAGNTASTDYISKEDAISKALSHAGLKKDQVSRLRAELDREDGRTVYEVDFETAQWEYEYEINAETGAVIKAEKEHND